MIKATQTIGNYTLVFSGDPALDLPVFMPCAACTVASDSAPLCAPCVADRDEKAKERDRLLELARNTGDWDAITKPGEQPTFFCFRPLPGTAFQWWAGQTARNQLTGLESSSLALRLGLIDVKNFGKHEVKRRTNEDGQELCNTKIIDAIYAEAGGTAAVELVVELGTLVIDRARAGIPPLSSKG